MKLLLWLVTLFALAVGISLAAHNQGYVLLVLPPYRAEISLNLAVVLLLGGFVLLYALARGIALILSLPRRVRDFRARRLREKLADQYYDVARLVFEGRFSQALKLAGEVYAGGQKPALAALLAARATQRLQEPAKQKEWLERALAADPRMEAACLMIEAETLVEMAHYAPAIALLRRLQEKTGRHIAALQLELRAQQGERNWDAVLHIARQLEHHAALSSQAAQEIKLAAHRANILERRGDVTRLDDYERQLPATERSPQIVGLLADMRLESATDGSRRHRSA
ncbi:MAG: heme biosynthesis HemY N-terminal domain-containing protein [Propionivibrio sp.]